MEAAVGLFLAGVLVGAAGSPFLRHLLAARWTWPREQRRLRRQRRALDWAGRAMDACDVDRGRLAWRLARRALRLDPAGHHSRIAAGRSHEALRRYDVALKWYQRAREEAVHDRFRDEHHVRFVEAGQGLARCHGYLSRQGPDEARCSHQEQALRWIQRIMEFDWHGAEALLEDAAFNGFQTDVQLLVQAKTPGVAAWS